ncbi:MAG: Tyrosine--tRNA ligase [archaeon ADurb.Bin336]|nr:MAG: Tyrosine--tRNA ligase [archaeon ADurb.Bin336]
MNPEEKIDLIKSIGVEIIEEKELEELINSNKPIIAYDGFEPSGQMHIAQGILRTINTNKLTKSGAKFKIIIADWFAWANNRLGGDLEKIKLVGEYFIEVWKTTGMDLDNVEFIWASELIKDPKYWEIVMKVSTKNSLNRIIRCSQIMGRSDTDNLKASQILYPCMQCADIFYLNANIVQLGLDQRKVNVLAREIGEEIGYYKPIIVSHPMLQGLQKPNNNLRGIEHEIAKKMSKSNPKSAIFMTDTKEEIEAKISEAYCPPQIEENPILEYIKLIVFPKINCFSIQRPEKYGGDKNYFSYKELEEEYIAKKIHPLDLKKALSKHLNEILKPTRKHFQENEKAKKLLEEIKKF